MVEGKERVDYGGEYNGSRGGNLGALKEMGFHG